MREEGKNSDCFGWRCGVCVRDWSIEGNHTSNTDL